METNGYLTKIASKEDGRVTFLRLTEKGIALSEKYDRRFFGILSTYLEDISEEDVNIMIRTIEQVYQIMCERRISLDE